MRNTECHAYKITELRNMRTHKMRVRDYAHDCGCRIQKAIEKTLVAKVWLDGYHATKHKCKMKGFSKPGFNSTAAEQLWNVMDNLNKSIGTMKRVHYRFMLRHYCIWRNSYARSMSKDNAHPITSKRKAVRRGCR